MNFNEYEEVINKINGIMKSKIVSVDGNIMELHILANSTRPGKQLVRDIESTLLTAFDYRIDRRLISIAQIQTEEKDTSRRIKFLGISMNTLDNVIECSVKLSYEEEEHVSTQVGIKTDTNRKKIVAEATVKAIESILGQAYVFDVLEVIVTAREDIAFVSVLVVVVLNEVEEVMVGSVMVRNDINEAIAKATLDAVNRRVEIIKN